MLYFIILYYVMLYYVILKFNILSIYIYLILYTVSFCLTILQELPQL